MPWLVWKIDGIIAEGGDVVKASAWKIASAAYDFAMFQIIEPLSSLLRPSNFDEYAGQKHLVGPNAPIRRIIDSGRLVSMIFWGPPGTGKTSLAYLISKTVDADFYHLSGVVSKKEDLTQIIGKARANFAQNRRTVLFLDEIHRWNKAQQDALLPYVEKGVITLVGATTENPSFTIVRALLSRAKVFTFEPLSPTDVAEHLKTSRKRIHQAFPSVEISDEAIDFLSGKTDGDLRFALSVLEQALVMKGEGTLTAEDLVESAGKILAYDRNGDNHYDTISAMHKSLRDSDGDAAIYYVGRMLASGEDPRYVARRMLNFAAEDVGLADPQALLYANMVYDVCEKVGMPEAELQLCWLAYYLARAPKDNRVYVAMNRMRRDVAEFGNLPIPLHIRNAPTSLMKELGYGKGYEYAHDLPGKKSSQEHFPKGLEGRRYFPESGEDGGT